MGSLQPWHWLVLAVVVILVFGAKRLPDMARSLGKSLRIFKSEIRELQEENKPDSSAPSAAQPTSVQSERVDPPAAPASGQGHTEGRSA